MRSIGMLSILASIGCSTSEGDVSSSPVLALEFITPAGDDLHEANAEVGNRHLVGDDCQANDWFLVQGLTNGILAWFPVDRAVPIVISEDAVTAFWGAGPTPDRVVGGVGRVVSDESTLFEYVIDESMACTWDLGLDDYSCSDSLASVTIRLTGEDLGELEAPGQTGYVGSSGWATDSVTGEDRCGGGIPGT